MVWAGEHQCAAAVAVVAEAGCSEMSSDEFPTFERRLHNNISVNLASQNYKLAGRYFQNSPC